MNKIILGIGFLAGIFFGLRGADAYMQVKHDGTEITKTKENIARMNISIERMSGFPDGDLPVLTDNVRYLYGSVDVLSHYRGIKSTVHTEGADEQGTLARAFKPSEWLGVMKARVKVSFPDIIGVDQYTAVLAFMHQMENDRPLRVMDMEYQGKGLSFDLNVYGRSSV